MWAAGKKKKEACVGVGLGRGTDEGS